MFKIIAPGNVEKLSTPVELLSDSDIAFYTRWSSEHGYRVAYVTL